MPLKKISLPEIRNNGIMTGRTPLAVQASLKKKCCELQATIYVRQYQNFGKMVIRVASPLQTKCETAAPSDRIRSYATVVTTVVEGGTAGSIFFWGSQTPIPSMVAYAWRIRLRPLATSTRQCVPFRAQP